MSCNIELRAPSKLPPSFAPLPLASPLALGMQMHPGGQKFNHPSYHKTTTRSFSSFSFYTLVLTSAALSEQETIAPNFLYGNLKAHPLDCCLTWLCYMLLSSQWTGSPCAQLSLLPVRALHKKCFQQQLTFPRFYVSQGQLLIRGSAERLIYIAWQNREKDRNGWQLILERKSYRREDLFRVRFKELKEAMI